MAEFRFVYTTDRYEETVAFWEEQLGLEKMTEVVFFSKLPGAAT